MAINWNMDVNSLKTLFKKRTAERGERDTVLISSTQKIWRLSIMFLYVFAILIAAYDGYIFWAYVLTQQDVDIADQGSVTGIDRTLFDRVSGRVQERAESFERAKTMDPLRNPFGEPRL